MKKCTICQKDFTPKNNKGKFCSVACKQKQQRINVAEKLRLLKELQAPGGKFINLSEISRNAPVKSHRVDFVPSPPKISLNEAEIPIPIEIKKGTLIGNVIGSDIPPEPTKEKGEDVFDFAMRKNEWKKKYGHLVKKGIDFK